MYISLSKRSIYLRKSTLCMLVLLCLALSMRLVLLLSHWPVVNADESIMDLMARHIAYQGEHPVVFWGQDYMGTSQAYLGAVLIHLFGSTVLSVRLGTLLMFAIYFLCLYFLVRLLYTPAFALFCVAFLSIGSERMMSVPLMANGGYAETMMFGAAIFLIVSWLALTLPAESAPVWWPRLLVYGLLGTVIGLSLWSDQLILSAIFTGGFFLLVCCRREIRGRVIWAFVVGLLIGAIPLILYNLSAQPFENSLFVLFGTVFTNAPRVIPFWQQVAEVMFISLPYATGLPFTAGGQAICTNAEPYTHSIGGLSNLFPSAQAGLCLATRGGWALGILLLWGIALTGTLLALRQLRARRREDASRSESEGERRQRVRLYANMMLLGSGAIWLLLFALGQAAPVTPRGSSRYLICLLLSVPVVLWPLWLNVSQVRIRLKGGQRYARTRFLLSALVLLVVGAVYIMGTEEAFAGLPADQHTYNQINAVARTLEEHGITRFYSDYDTCSILIFRSNERAICSVLDEQLQPGENRYAPYTALVSAAPHPAYLFPVASPANQLLECRFAQDGHYRHIALAGYSIYYYQVAS